MKNRFLSILLTLMLLFSLTASAEVIPMSAMTPDELYAKGQEYYSHDRSVTFTLWKEAAQAGHADAMFGVGTMYLTGEGGEQDMDQAIYWLEKASVAGHSDAQANLGAVAWQQGDAEEARRLWMQGAKDGNGSCMYSLGSAAYQENDLETAAEWWTKSAGAGSPSGADMMWQMYWHGLGVEQSDAKAVEWLEKGVELGSANCAYQLGLWYENGNVVKQSNQKTFEIYKLAAEWGHAEAMCNLSWCYSNGIGTQPSKDLALEWLENAAYAGDAMAMCSLAGILLQLDNAEAHEDAVNWLKRSADLGYEPAWEQLNKLGY